MAAVAEGAVTQAVAVRMAGVCVGGIRNHLAGGMGGMHSEAFGRGGFHDHGHMNFAHDRGFDRDRRFDHDRDFRFDHDHDHDRFRFGFFPGFFVGALPWGYLTVYADGVPYYYSQGYYYEPDGQGYETVAPPLGAVVAQLPSDAVIVNVGGTNYYYASGAYYLPQSNGGT